VTSRPERRLAAIMVADVVGYSRMMEVDEAGTIAAVRVLRAETIEPLLTDYKGRVVKILGDGLIVEFSSVVDAVGAAVDMQKVLGAKQADLPPDRRIAFRVGINLGDVVVDGEDLLGDGVNVAARLEQLCEPGGVLVSGTGFDQLQGKIALPVEFVGEQRVKNIARPVRAYRVRLDGSPPRSWKSRGLRPRRLIFAVGALSLVLAFAGTSVWILQSDDGTFLAFPSIAVLPFRTTAGDEPARRLASGLMDNIVRDLTRYRTVDVIAHDSTAAYEGKPVDPRQVGQDLSVDYVLVGSVQRQEGQLRIIAQLLDSETAKSQWSDSWDRPVADFFAVETEISEQVAAQVVGWRGAIFQAEVKARRQIRPQDMTLYDTYLRAAEALQQFTEDSVAEAIPLLESVVKEDPQFASGWLSLASAYAVSTDFGADTEIVLPKALEAVQRALELDPMDADAHAQLGQILGTQGDLKRAEAEFETALSLNPGSADVMSTYITFASTLGHPERGAELADRAIRLDPRYPPGKTTPFGYAYLMAGRYEDALRVFERQSTESYNQYTWVFRSVSHAALGQLDEAKVWAAKTLEQHPDLTIEGLLGVPGWNDVERKFLSQAMRSAGFPLCAPGGERVSFDMTSFLPECKQTPPGT
jgi:class 3 adenylate cyclase/TolB-like protein/Tfp pilus assembly protein PilF